MTLYEFRLRKGNRSFDQWIDTVSDAIDVQSYPDEIEDMVRLYDLSPYGHTCTSDKRKADMFLTWMSGLSGWGKKSHPMKWRVKEMEDHG